MSADAAVSDTAVRDAVTGCGPGVDAPFAPATTAAAAAATLLLAVLHTSQCLDHSQRQDLQRH